MSESIEPAEPPSLASTIVGWVLGTLMAAVVLGVMASCLWVGAAFYQLGSDRIVAIEPGEVADSAAGFLANLGVSGPPPRSGPDRDRVEETLRGQIRALKGCHTYGGMQGDGEDAYWVELSPELAAKVREVVPNSAVFKPYSFGPPGASSIDWWPKQWPKSTTCYQDGRGCFLMVPDAGNQLWYMFWRS